MRLAEWNDRTKLAAAAAAAAAGIFVAFVSLTKPTWLRLRNSEPSMVSLPATYLSGQVFSNRSIDMYPTEETLPVLLFTFGERVRDRAKHLGLTQKQVDDLVRASTERLEAILDPDPERDYARARDRGLLNKKEEAIGQAKAYSKFWESRRLSPFGLNDLLLVPAHSHKFSERFQQLREVPGVGQLENRLPKPPRYQNTNAGRQNATFIEILIPMQVPLVGVGSGEYLTDQTGVIVFGFEFCWVAARGVWIPEKYYQYEYSNFGEGLTVGGYPMAF